MPSQTFFLPSMCVYAGRMGRPRGTRCQEGHLYTTDKSGRNRCLICQASKRVRSPRITLSLGERLWARVDVRGPEDCWPWLGSVGKHPDRGGYGHIREAGRGSRTLLVHRVVYEKCVGPIPENHDVDHKCHNGSGCEGRGPECLHRRCCNPAHLEAVTHSTNLERGYHRGESRA